MVKWKKRCIVGLDGSGKSISGIWKCGRVRSFKVKKMYSRAGLGRAGKSRQRRVKVEKQYSRAGVGLVNQKWYSGNVVGREVLK